MDVRKRAKDARILVIILVLPYAKANAALLVVVAAHLGVLALASQTVLDAMDVQIAALLVVLAALGVQVVVLGIVIQHVEMDVRLLVRIVVLAVLADVLVAALDAALLARPIVLANVQIPATQLAQQPVSILALAHVTEL